LQAACYGNCLQSKCTVKIKSPPTNGQLEKAKNFPLSDVHLLVRSTTSFHKGKRWKIQTSYLLIADIMREITPFSTMCDFTRSFPAKALRRRRHWTFNFWKRERKFRWNWHRMMPNTTESGNKVRPNFRGSYQWLTSLGKIPRSFPSSSINFVNRNRNVIMWLFPELRIKFIESFRIALFIPALPCEMCYISYRIFFFPLLLYIKYVIIIKKI